MKIINGMEMRWKKIKPYRLLFLKIVDELFIKACTAIFRHMVYHAKMRYMQNLHQIQPCMLKVNYVLFEEMQMTHEKIRNVAVLNYIFHLYVMLGFQHLFCLL